MSKQKIVVVGLGEIGRPLLEIIRKYHDAVGVDIAPLALKIESVDVLHICYPFEIKDFVGETARYISLFSPALTIISSTIAVGTTRTIAEYTGAAVVHSPVRGKHVRMRDDLHQYDKFVGALEFAHGKQAIEHFESVGFKTRLLSSPEATELAKLTETTYFGLLIAWAQEVERYCDRISADYDEIVSFYEEIGFFPPVKYTPGIIGGHCVMPNLDILRKLGRSEILEAIRSSNQMKIGRETGRESSIAIMATRQRKSSLGEAEIQTPKAISER